MFSTFVCVIMLLVWPTFGYKDEKPNKYTKFDYCTIKCKEGIHSACPCQITPPRQEVEYFPSYMEFRKWCVDRHNEKRNYIASGQETRPKEGWFPKAGNMMVISYDTELEYIARCFGLTTWKAWPNTTDPHDKCRNRIGNKYTGQNLSGSGANNSNHVMLNGVNAWYDEVKLITNEFLIDKFISQHGTGHFTQMVWAEVDRIGCATVHHPENRLSYQFAYICNYGSTRGHGGNGGGKVVYKRSEVGCDACPEGTKCGETPEYPALCGKQEPIPTELPALILKARSADAIKLNKLCLCLALIVLYLTI